MTVYEIALDFINYKKIVRGFYEYIFDSSLYTDMTDSLFNTRWELETLVWNEPWKKWKHVVLGFPDRHGDNVFCDFCGSEERICTPEDVKRYGLTPNRRISDSLAETQNIPRDRFFEDGDGTYEGVEPGYYEGGHPFYNCFKIFWRFELNSDDGARKLAEFTVKRAQEFMMNPELRHSRMRGALASPEERREIPAEIYRFNGYENPEKIPVQ